MNGFASIVLFMVLINHSTGVLEFEVKKILDLPRRLDESASLDSDFAEPCLEIPEEIFSQGLAHLQSKTGKALDLDYLGQGRARKYSVLFEGEGNRKNVVIVPIGNPPQIWGMQKNTDLTRSTVTWWILYADPGVTRGLQYDANENWS